ncbi:hypothetical protein MXB_3779 [Myxobolus squamalis]|nr:hypothetical protein MXB_3779 [Myxobolus squamalis]
MITKRPKSFGIGRSIQPKSDLTRFVKWPKYVRIQRQEKILNERLKAPPSINQFRVSLDNKLTANIVKFAKRYSPETPKEKKYRMTQIAKEKIKAEKKGTSSTPSSQKPYVLKCGFNHVTSLIEQKKALLVLIATDVYPLELVVWLPALCRKMNVPYCLIKSKARLGTLVNQKTATCLCFTRIKPEHKTRFALILKSIESSFVPAIDIARKKWSLPILSGKSQRKVDAKTPAAVITSL